MLDEVQDAGNTVLIPHPVLLLLPYQRSSHTCDQWPKLLVTIFRNLVNLVTIFRNLVKSRNKVRFGLAFTIAKRYYIHV